MQQFWPGWLCIAKFRTGGRSQIPHVSANCIHLLLCRGKATKSEENKENHPKIKTKNKQTKNKQTKWGNSLQPHLHKPLEELPMRLRSNLRRSKRAFQVARPKEAVASRALRGETLALKNAVWLYHCFLRFRGFPQGHCFRSLAFNKRCVCVCVGKPSGTKFTFGIVM